MVYDDKQMAAILREVEEKFSKHLEKAEKEMENLKKSEETQEPVENIQKNEQPVEEVIEFDYDEEDIAEMNKLYASMNKTEAKAHFEAVKKVLFGDEEPIQKTENTKEIEDLKKSEELLKTEIETVKKENEDLKKSLEKLISVLGKKTNKPAPSRKAIEKIEWIKKSEAEKTPEENKKDISELSKKEITEILNNKIKNGKLKKSDKEAINNYYLETNNIETIKHLL